MTQECTIDKIVGVLSDLQNQLPDKSESFDKGGSTKSLVGSCDTDPPLSDTSQSKKANNNEQSSQKPIKEKKRSLFFRVIERCKKIGNEKSEASNKGSESGGSQGGSSRRSSSSLRNDDDEAQEKAELEVSKLRSDIRQMKAAFENLIQFQGYMSKSLETDLRSKKLKAILENKNSISSRSDDLKEIRRKIFTLKCQIPSLLYKQSSRGLSTTGSQTAEENGEIDENGSNLYLPGLHVSEELKKSSAFEEVFKKFGDLEFTRKLCLLSFAVFPENREVKRTMLMYWWIGEGFIEDNDYEKSVRSILNDFLEKRLLEPVEDERKLKPNSYKMEPHVHSAVVYLAELMDLFVLYGSKGLTMDKSKKEKVCLVRGSSLQPEAKASAMDRKSLTTIFNSSERYPDFTFKWFIKGMNSLQVLYLGRWERTATRHIEVESTEFLKNMKFLKNLRLVSFQGISRIEKLEESICALRELVILDLRACYNLEELHDDIGSLEKLIYLDVSECYMLDRMPKGVANLYRLQVLKGFVISENDDESDCAVKHLLKLRKLSITVNKFDFKVEKLMRSLKDLDQLVSLKISWGASFEKEEKENQRGLATEEKHKDLKERGNNEVHKKGQTSEEKKGDEEETGKREAVQEDGVSGKKENGNGDGRNEKASIEEGKKHDEVKAEKLKSDKVVEGEKKASPSRESTEIIQNKLEDQKGKDKMEEEGDGDKGKADQEEGKKASPSGESTETMQNKLDEQKGKSDVEEDGDKGKADLEEGKKQDEVVEGEKKASPSRESSDTIQKKPDDKSKEEKEGDGDKGKADIEEGKKQDEVKAESSKSNNGVEGVKKASPSRESKDASQSTPDDHQKGDKQEKKGDEEGKKKDEVKVESSKPDNVTTEGDEKTNPPQESKDTVQSKPNDDKENSKVQEKGEGEKKKEKLDGGEAKIQKSDKNTKIRKKVSFSENTIQKKPDDLERDNAMPEEIIETTTPSRPEKKPAQKSGSSKSKLPRKGNETFRWLTKTQEDLEIDTSKFPDSLRKLELECFPEETPPVWLYPQNLGKLEKLAIKGGKLSKIGNESPTAEHNSCVQILRLKYLHEFEAKWKELQALFPEMVLFEKYKCPKVAFCPTDGNGVWRSQTSPETTK